MKKVYCGKGHIEKNLTNNANKARKFQKGWSEITFCSYGGGIRKKEGRDKIFKSGGGTKRVGTKIFGKIAGGTNLGGH